MAKRTGDDPTPEEKGSRSEPNLELPSFRLGRRKKKTDGPVAEKTADVSNTTKRPPAPPTPPAPPRAPSPKPPAEPEPSQPQAKRAAPKRRPPAPPPPDEVLVPKRVPSPPSHVGVPGKGLSEAIPRSGQGTLPTTDPSPAPPKAKRAKSPKEPKPPKQPKAKKVRGERKTTPLPWLPGWLAAMLTGAACGALTVLLSWATAQGCDAVRGVGTCGGFGIFALVAILGIDVIIASALLRLFRVIDPATTSLLGVGLVAVSAMLFFLKDTQSQAMVYVIPILMGVTFAVAWWITKAIAEKVDD